MKKRSIYCFIFLKRICLFLVIFFLFSNGVFSQTTIKGKVTGPDGNGIEGATVNVKGTQTSTVTNTTGDYSIKVPGSNSVLVFSFIGFTTKEEKVGARTTISPNLITSASDLDQVIVIGYGTQKKRDVTGAIREITATSSDDQQPVSIFDAIQGAAPGVRVMSTSGDPGEEAGITIRGLSTLSDEGVKPLYIVDGVPMDNISTINPNDIQSI
ncbi:MAG: carboxypeptidase-like regulatory domain-containing protein, partial [Ginsengibacter sp.]